MERPYIICHMTTSVDGKVTGEFLGTAGSGAAIDTYYEINRACHRDAYACGRVTMEGGPYIEVLCETTPDAYFAYLWSIGVSYIFAGREEMDLPLALHKLKTVFGIERLLLEGGSTLNGAFERAGMIDELSFVVAPMTAAAEDQPLMDGGRMNAYRLREVKRCEGGVLWLNYTRES